MSETKELHPDYPESEDEWNEAKRMDKAKENQKLKDAKRVCKCGHNKLYHEPDCIGMMCNCESFREKNKHE